MSAGAYVIWFVAMAVFVSLLLGVGIVAASGYWAREERAPRAAARRSRRESRLESARQEARAEGRHRRHRWHHHMPVG
jgi:hypothetical protein